MQVAFTLMSSPTRQANAAFEVVLQSARAQVLLREPLAMVNTSSPPHMQLWRQPNGDALSDVSTGSTQRKQSHRTAYWTGAAVAQLPGVSASSLQSMRVRQSQFTNSR